MLKRILASTQGPKSRTINGAIINFLYNYIGSFISMLALSFFVLYCNIIVIKGHFYMGLHFIPVLDIFPLRINNTSLTGFLFNCEIITLTNYTLIFFICDIYANFGINSDIISNQKQISSNTKIFSWAA